MVHTVHDKKLRLDYIDSMGDLFCCRGVVESAKIVSTRNRIEFGIEILPDNSTSGPNSMSRNNIVHLNIQGEKLDIEKKVDKALTYAAPPNDSNCISRLEP